MNTTSNTAGVAPVEAAALSYASAHRNVPSPAHLELIAPIDASVNPADFTDSDHAEFQRMALHQAAFNALGRARCELLACRSDYTRAIKQAESAIAAMAALALMDGGGA